MPDQTPWTVLRLLNWTREHFERRGVDSPRLAAEVLLAHVLGCQRIQLYTRFDYQPTAEQLAAFRELLKRAAEQEPIAYLVGYKEFYSLKFKVTPDVLIPRPETELLVEQAITTVRSAKCGVRDRIGPEAPTVSEGHDQQRGQAPTNGFGASPRCWDACTGSGCVAVAIAVNVKNALVLATDISEKALAVAGENAAMHKVQDRVRIRQADLLTLPEDCRDLAPFDVITANAPYVAAGQDVAPSVKHEPAVALWAGKTGLDFISKIIEQAPPLLAAGGALILEFGQGQADAVRNLIVKSGSFSEPRILRDHQGIERAATAIKKS